MAAQLTQKVLPGQSIYDFALQHLGDVDMGVDQLIKLNPDKVNFNDNLVTGDDLIIGDVINQQVVDMFAAEPLKPASSWTDVGVVLPPPPYVTAINAGAVLGNIPALNYMSGSGPSLPSALFMIKGDGLNAAITLTLSANLEIWNGTSYVSGPLVFPYTDGTLETLEIYKVRLKAGLAPGSYNETITLSGGGAPNTVITASGLVSVANQFIITVKTDNAGTSASNEFTLPLRTGFTYNCWIDWGDGSTTNQLSAVSPTHSYAAAGIYTIKISGTFPAIFFFYGGDCLKLTAINQWGNIGWKIMGAAFMGCSNMIGTFTDVPDLSQVTDTSYMFYGCSSFNTDINNWNTKAFTRTSFMFYGCSSYNQPLNNWNVINVTDMSYMFSGCSVFNQDINSWNVSSVTVFDNTFAYCYAFNQSLNTWDVSSVQTFTNMFYYCSSFNGDINTWNVTNAVTMEQMFMNCSSFAQLLTAWSTPNLTTAIKTFSGCTMFNGNLSGWNVSHVTNASGMFNGCSSFNRNLNSWNVSSLTDSSLMFQGCTTYNQPMNNWNTVSLTNLFIMFGGCSAFNQPLNTWSTSTFTVLSHTFFQCASFNQNISGWDVSHVQDFTNMFYGCSSFNQSVNSWNMGSAMTVEQMFKHCVSFDQPLNSWNVSNITNFNGFMNGKSAADYSTAHLDGIYNSWSTQTLHANIMIDFASIKYTSAGSAGKAVLTGSPNNWTIIDGGT